MNLMYLQKNFGVFKIMHHKLQIKLSYLVYLSTYLYMTMTYAGLLHIHLKCNVNFVISNGFQYYLKIWGHKISKITFQTGMFVSISIIILYSSEFYVSSIPVTSILHPNNKALKYIIIMFSFICCEFFFDKSNFSSKLPMFKWI